MKQLILSAFLSLAALPSFATHSPTLYSCTGVGSEAGQKFIYASDVAGKAFVVMNGAQFYIGQSKDNMTWKRDITADKITTLTGTFGMKEHTLFGIEIVFPAIELPEADQPVRFTTSIEYTIRGDRSPDNKFEMDCFAREL